MEVKLPDLSGSHFELPAMVRRREETPPISSGDDIKLKVPMLLPAAKHVLIKCSTRLSNWCVPTSERAPECRQVLRIPTCQVRPCSRERCAAVQEPSL